MRNTRKKIVQLQWNTRYVADLHKNFLNNFCSKPVSHFKNFFLMPALNYTAKTNCLQAINKKINASN